MNKYHLIRFICEETGEVSEIERFCKYPTRYINAELTRRINRDGCEWKCEIIRSLTPHQEFERVKQIVSELDPDNYWALSRAYERLHECARLLRVHRRKH